MQFSATPKILVGGEFYHLSKVVFVFYIPS